MFLTDEHVTHVSCLGCQNPDNQKKKASKLQPSKKGYINLEGEREINVVYKTWDKACMEWFCILDLPEFFFFLFCE